MLSRTSFKYNRAYSLTIGLKPKKSRRPSITSLSDRAQAIQCLLATDQDNMPRGFLD
jgi:hypothetical protein